MYMVQVSDDMGCTWHKVRGPEHGEYMFRNKKLAERDAKHVRDMTGLLVRVEWAGDPVAGPLTYRPFAKLRRMRREETR